MHYRKDIDALRALAVVAVICYHLGDPRFQGGFVGVDVFFVISGFLITSITTSQIERKTFSLLNFYSRRVLRLLPVLSLVIGATAFFSYFLVNPNSFALLGGSIKYTGLIQTNLFFLQNSQDYFNQGVLKENPLLHLWSLAIEEQFYIFFPLLLLLLFRLIKAANFRLILFLLLTTGSFLYCYYLMGSDTNQAFYSLLSRSWELLIGACLAVGLKQHPRLNFLSKKKIVANFLYLLGLCGLVLIIYNYSHETKFPGFSALAPVLLTCLILYSGEHLQGLLRKIIESSAIVYIGIISYSLYLWHWPVMVFAKSEFIRLYLNFVPTQAMQISLITCISVLSYHLVENPLRKIRLRSKGNIFAVASAFIVFSSFYILGNAVNESQISQSYSEEYFQQLPKADDVPFRRWQMKETDIPDLFKGKASVIVGDPLRPPMAVILGDSYASMWGDALNDFLKAHKKSALLLAMEGCPFLWDLNRPIKPICAEFNKAREFFITNSPIKKIILASSWRLVSIDGFYNYKTADDFEDRNFNMALERTLSHLKKKKIYVVASHIEPNLPALTIYVDTLIWHQTDRTGHNIQDYSRKNLWFSEMFKNLEEAKIRHKIKILNPNEILCPKGDCYILKDEKLLMHDEDHLNIYGSHLLVPIYRKIF